MLSGTETQGTATTVLRDVGFNVTSCELRKHSNFPIDENDTYEVTNDGGVTWETITIASGSVHNFSSTGSIIGIRLTLNRTSGSDTSPAYKSICLLYK